MARGRPKKIRFFRGNSNQSNMVDFNIIAPPVGLINIGNTCFFNAVMQNLYNLPLFRTHVANNDFVSEAASSIKNLLNSMHTSTNAIRSNCVCGLRLPGYQYPLQYDAHECLVNILNHIFPSITTDDIFKVHVQQLTECERGYNSTIPVINNHLSIQIPPAEQIQSVSDLLDNFQRGERLDDHPCPTCGEEDNPRNQIL